MLALLSVVARKVMRAERPNIIEEAIKWERERSAAHAAAGSAMEADEDQSTCWRCPRHAVRKRPTPETMTHGHTKRTRRERGGAAYAEEDKSTCPRHAVRKRLTQKIRAHGHRKGARIAKRQHRHGNSTMAAPWHKHRSSNTSTNTSTNTMRRSLTALKHQPQHPLLYRHQHQL